tara:strand:- start:365 stop:580 length:216 start_codon:yes stop_codon:yes gene_type:complete
MKIDCLINGQIKLVIHPENDMETEVLKQLMKQDNMLSEIRSSVQILGKTITHAIMIERKPQELLSSKIEEQ